MPRLFAGDANAGGDDPFGPVPVQRWDSIEGRACLHYFDIDDKLADEEYFAGGLGKAIAEYMDQHYASFTVMLAHVGFTAQSAVATVLIVGRRMSLDHATEIKALFHSFACTRIRGILFYDGDNSRTADEHPFRFTDRLVVE